MKEDKARVIPDEPLAMEKWTYKGKPLRILSTSLGIALVANMLLMSSAYGETASPTPGVAGSPTLVEYSSEAVKKYYDPNVDWNIPVPFDDKGQAIENTKTDSGSSATDSNSNHTTIINNGGGYGGGGGGWGGGGPVSLIFY